MSWIDFNLEETAGLSLEEFLAIQGGNFELNNYDHIFEYLDAEVALKVSDDDYQGDTRYLILHDQRGWGISIVGWGSCTGCDALQSCTSGRERLELVIHIRDQIRWFLGAGEAIHYLENHDWAGDHHGRSEETTDFIEKATAFLQHQRGSHAELERFTKTHVLPPNA